MSIVNINKYPYTDFHEMNLDWVINTVQELKTEIDDHLAEYIREQLDTLFIDSTYDSTTETITLVLSQEDE